MHHFFGDLIHLQRRYAAEVVNQHRQLVAFFHMRRKLADQHIHHFLAVLGFHGRHTRLAVDP